MSVPPKPDPPSGLAERGATFWRRTVDAYELTPSEEELLTEVCRVMDECEALSAALATEGVTVVGSTGQPRTHPAVTDLRQNRLALGRLLGQLALPDVDGALIMTPTRARAKRAAAARWQGHVNHSDSLRGAGG